MIISRPTASKAEVLARYEEHSHAPEEHRKMLSSAGTWENRFDEIAQLIAWGEVRSWLDVGCGTGRFFEKLVARPEAASLERCVGVDAIVNNLETARRKSWPSSPAIRFLQHDIEQLDTLGEAPFDLVTMVGVVYQCGVPPALAIEKCIGRLRPNARLVVTTENPVCERFVADVHGCYPTRAEFEAILASGGRRPSTILVQYTNPLWGQRATGITEAQSGDFKEAFYIASYTAGDGAA